MHMKLSYILGVVHLFVPAPHARVGKAHDAAPAYIAHSRLCIGLAQMLSKSRRLHAFRRRVPPRFLSVFQATIPAGHTAVLPACRRAREIRAGGGVVTSY